MSTLLLSSLHRLVTSWVPSLSAFVNYSSSFVSVETVVITAAESVNLHKLIPEAANRVTHRIGFFYIPCAFLTGLMIHLRNADLVSGTENANSSP